MLGGFSSIILAVYDDIIDPIFCDGILTQIVETMSEFMTYNNTY